MNATIHPSDARRASVHCSGIGANYPSGIEGSLAALRRLGSVQIDTISVVERAHHHVLWTRNTSYDSDHLGKLEAEPRCAIEYWSHAAAYVPIEGYRFCIPRMERIRAEGHDWFKVDKKSVHLVRRRIHTEGPMRAQDFEDVKGREGWWDWKPAKRALEYLFHAGELVAVGRRGFQKIYDLAERALPAGLDLRRPSSAEMAAFYVDHAAQTLGIFAETDVAYMRRDGIEDIPAEITARVEEGRLVKVKIAAGNNEPGVESAERAGRAFYAAPEQLAKRPPRLAAEGALVVLSPFDPLIIDRKRSKRIFGVAYQLECYLSAGKREFGYFALPLLFLGPDGDATLVGRLDAKADRGRGVLVAKRLSLDPPKTREKDLSAAAFARIAADALADFAAFNGAGSLELERFESENGRLERSLRAAVARLA
jgi:uncharacterized protein